MSAESNTGFSYLLGSGEGEYTFIYKSIFLKCPHIHYHLYADDPQIYTSFRPSAIPNPFSYLFTTTLLN